MPYRRYGETMESVAAQIETAREAIGSGADRRMLLELMPPGAARNALDCALWDLEAKTSGIPVHARLSPRAASPLEHRLYPVARHARIDGLRRRANNSGVRF